VIVNLEPVLFVSFTALAALLVFMVWLPKLKLVGVNVMLGVAPVPVRVAVCGLFVALSVTTTVPERVPVAVGVNTTLIAQVAPAATELPQVLVCEKSPVVETLVMASGPAPVLVSVTVCAGLAVSRA
jgi:hypothetical protein